MSELHLIVAARSTAGLLAYGVTVTISDILAVLGLLIAWDQYRRNQTSRQAVAQLKRSLFKQRSSQYFEELSRKAATLSSALRSRNWEEDSELVTQLSGLISSASGSSKKLILQREEDELNLAAASLKAIWDGIPVNPETHPVTDDKIQELMRQCIVIVYAVDKVGGRMKYLGELEGELEEEQVGEASSLRKQPARNFCARSGP